MDSLINYQEINWKRFVGSWAQIIHLGFGREREALAESMRSPNPRRNISSDKLNENRV